jgi:hypothetical protein
MKKYSPEGEAWGCPAPDRGVRPIAGEKTLDVTYQERHRIMLKLVGFSGFASPAKVRAGQMATAVGERGTNRTGQDRSGSDI